MPGPLWGKQFGMNRVQTRARCRGLVTSAGTTALAAAGTGVGAALGVTRAALGVVDPRSWAADDWAADVLPYLVYAVVTGLFVEGIDRGTSAHSWRR